MKYKLLFIIFQIFSKHNIKDKEFVLPIEKNLKGMYIVKYKQDHLQRNNFILTSLPL